MRHDEKSQNHHLTHLLASQPSHRIHLPKLSVQSSRYSKLVTFTLYIPYIIMHTLADLIDFLDPEGALVRARERERTYIVE